MNAIMIYSEALRDAGSKAELCWALVIKHGWDFQDVVGYTGDTSPQVVNLVRRHSKTLD